VTINFFDGFDGFLVWSVYGIIGGLTILWQLYRCLFKNSKITRKYEMMNEELVSLGDYKKINVSVPNDTTLANDSTMGTTNNTNTARTANPYRM